MKIAIIGNAGSGKSTLALHIHKMLQLPIYHLDQYYWKPNWIESDYSEFEKIHNQLCDQKAWIIEGMNTRLLEYRFHTADIIIFLDRSRFSCLLRVMLRALKHRNKVTFSSATECPERFPPPLKFLRFIWHFNNKQRLHIVSLIEKYKNQKKIFIVRKAADLENVLKKLV